MLLKSNKMEREEYLKKFEEYDSRIDSLEFEKTHLNQNLEQTTNVSQANQEEVERLRKELRYCSFMVILQCCI